MRLYQRFCGGCHGGSAVSGGVLPDLRHSALLANREGWSRIVRDGALESRGMVGFGREIGADDAEAIRAYVIERRLRDEPDVSR